MNSAARVVGGGPQRSRSAAVAASAAAGTPLAAAQTDDVASLANGAVDSLAEAETVVLGTVQQVWNDFVAHLPFLAAGALVLLFTWLLTRILAFFMGRALRRARLRASLKDLLLKLITLLIWIIGLLLAAMVVFPGVTPVRALSGLGIVSIAVGFAFKEIFENFFAGILLLWKFPFESDDYIECKGFRGQVEKIDVRTTLLRQITGELVIVPNSFLFKNPVSVLTNQASRRIAIEVGIAYGEPIEPAVAVIEEAVAACDTIRAERPVQVFPRQFDDSGIAIEIAWWTAPDPLSERRSRAEVVTAVKQALDEAGIEIPFPYRTLTFKEPLAFAQSAGPDTSPEDDSTE